MNVPTRNAGGCVRAASHRTRSGRPSGARAYGDQGAHLTATRQVKRRQTFGKACLLAVRAAWRRATGAANRGGWRHNCGLVLSCDGTMSSTDGDAALNMAKDTHAFGWREFSGAWCARPEARARAFVAIAWHPRPDRTCGSGLLKAAQKHACNSMCVWPAVASQGALERAGSGGGGGPDTERLRSAQATGSRARCRYRAAKPSLVQARG